jgi:hypothetical protein
VDSNPEPADSERLAAAKVEILSQYLCRSASRRRWRTMVREASLYRVSPVTVVVSLAVSVPTAV